MRRAVMSLLVTLSLALPAAAAGLDVGDRAPDLLLTEAGSGRGVRLQDVVSGHRYTVVAFVSTRCDVADLLDDALRDARAQLPTDDVAVLAVHSSADEETAMIAGRAIAAHTGVPALRDRDATAANAFGVRHAPEYFVLDDDGRVVHHGVLATSERGAGLPDTIRALERGVSPPVRTPVSTVCAIVRR